MRAVGWKERRVIHGRETSSRCRNGEHNFQCDQLSCKCRCYDWEPVESRAITPETELDRHAPLREDYFEAAP